LGKFAGFWEEGEQFVPHGLDRYTSDYLLVLTFLLASVAFAVVPLAIARFLAPRKPSETKDDIYECGMRTTGETWIQFKVQYYIYALLFVIFDIETVFLYPWAVAFNKLGLFAFVEMVIFLTILVGGLVYAWRKGVLEWV
jgi:NADH:ubiquinone oxidoreductase subunit 3 (subunit A)